MSQLSHTSEFNNQLYGNAAFYNKINYVERTKADLSCDFMHRAVNYGTSHKEQGVVERMLGYLNFFYTLHCYAGTLIIPASKYGKVSRRSSNHLKHIMRLVVSFPIHYCISKLTASHTQSKRVILPNQLRMGITLTDEWKYRRFSISFDACTLDMMIVCKATRKPQKRWTLYTNGSRECYETRLHRRDFKPFLNATNSNALVFNPPGVGASRGILSQETMIKGYQFALRFLEENIQPEEIQLQAFSFGVLVQLMALQDHTFKDPIRYVALSDRGPSSLKEAVSSFISPLAGRVVGLLGWEMDASAAAATLRIPHVIAQRFDQETSALLDDDVITASSSLAHSFLQGRISNKEMTFVGISEKHNQPLESDSIEGLSGLIERLFKAFSNS
jgi:hypothetical protein